MPPPIPINLKSEPSLEGGALAPHTAMERLNAKGLISDPATKARSVILSDTGLRQAEAAFHKLFESAD